MVLILFLGINTAVGYYMLQQLYKDYPDFLKPQYYIEAIVFVLIPQSVAILFFVIVFVVICLLVIEQRRRHRYRLEEEGMDFVEDNGHQIDEIVETYMRMLDNVNYDKDICKFYDCAICLKEFD